MTRAATDINTQPLAAALEQWKQSPATSPPPWLVGKFFDTAAVDCFSNGVWPRAQALLRVWQQSRADKLIAWPDGQRIHVAIHGFSTLDYLAAQLSAALLADGLVPAVSVGGHNKLFQELALLSRGTQHDRPDLIWIWASLRDLLPGEIWSDRAKLLSNAGLSAVDDAIAMLGDAIASARARSGAMFIVNDFSPDEPSIAGIADWASPLSLARLYRHANSRLAEEIAPSATFPLSYYLARMGLNQAIDRRMEFLASCRYRPEFFFAASQGMRAVARSLRGLSRKVLMLDLDNTLWGGVVGEDGPGGIRIDGDAVGRAHMAFQQAVLELHRRGVILAINSRNNIADVEEAFQLRPEMPLALEHFASIQANWDDKAINARRIAAELNIGLDAMVLWDDDPQQRAMMREAIGEVYVVQPPSDISQWPDHLRHLGLFDTLHLTTEDSARGAMYAQDRIRRQAAGSWGDLESFLGTLNLEVRVEQANESNAARLCELLARTNQFNLTTRRHNRQQLEQWMAQPSWSVLGFSAKDRFGSYGLVGATILHRAENALEVESLLLSCRAMGKGVEDAMLWAVALQAGQWSLQRIEALYIPTRKNAPIRSFLDKHFQSDDQASQEILYVLDLSRQPVQLPPHIRCGYPEHGNASQWTNHE